MAASSTSVPSKFKCALIQLFTKPLDIEANFAAAERHIRDAAAQGADLAVLPEFHLFGLVKDRRFLPLAHKSNEYVRKYQALAKELKINIVPGGLPTPAEGRTSKPNLLNSTPFISSTGEVLGTYHKVNVWIPERAYFLSGADVQTYPKSPPQDPAPLIHPVFDTPLGRVGIIVCWDLAFPEAVRSLVRQGAKIIIAPTCWLVTDMTEEGLKYNPDSELDFLKSTLVSRAFENTCCMIFCNAGGPKEDGWAGISRVTMPIIGTLPNAFEDSTPGMKIVEIDTHVCDVAESAYEIRRDLACENWHYGYKK